MRDLALWVQRVTNALQVQSPDMFDGIDLDKVIAEIETAAQLTQYRGTSVRDAMTHERLLRPSCQTDAS